MTTTTVSEKQIDVKAAGWSLGIHALLLLLLSFIFFNQYLQQEPPPIEQGMEVNLGTDDNGSGTDQPMYMNDPAPISAQGPNGSNAPQGANSSELLTSDEPDAAEINNPNTVKSNNPRNTTSTRPNRQNTSTANNNNNTRRLNLPQYREATGPGGNSADENRPGTGEGNTTGPGDRGVPGGTPGASNYIGHNLSGRSISPRTFAAEFREGGTVVIRVTVNREGQIVNKVVKSSPSAELTRIAMQKISQAKFSKNANAAPEQMGDVTIKFKAR